MGWLEPRFCPSRSLRSSLLCFRINSSPLARKLETGSSNSASSAENRM